MLQDIQTKVVISEKKVIISKWEEDQWQLFEADDIWINH